MSFFSSETIADGEVVSGGGSGGDNTYFFDDFTGTELEAGWTKATDTGVTLAVGGDVATFTIVNVNGSATASRTLYPVDDLPLRVEWFATHNAGSYSKYGIRLSDASNNLDVLLGKHTSDIQPWIEGSAISNQYNPTSLGGSQWFALELDTWFDGSGVRQYLNVWTSNNDVNTRPTKAQWTARWTNYQLNTNLTGTLDLTIIGLSYSVVSSVGTLDKLWAWPAFVPEQE